MKGLKWMSVRQIFLFLPITRAMDVLQQAGTGHFSEEHEFTSIQVTGCRKRFRRVVVGFHFVIVLNVYS